MGGNLKTFLTFKFLLHFFIFFLILNIVVSIYLFMFLFYFIIIFLSVLYKYSLHLYNKKIIIIKPILWDPITKKRWHQYAWLLFYFKPYYSAFNVFVNIVVFRTKLKLNYTSLINFIYLLTFYLFVIFTGFSVLLFTYTKIFLDIYIRKESSEKSILNTYKMYLFKQWFTEVEKLVNLRYINFIIINRKIKVLTNQE
jgi:hypothetical protein